MLFTHNGFSMLASKLAMRAFNLRRCRNSRDLRWIALDCRSHYSTNSRRTDARQSLFRARRYDQFISCRGGGRPVLVAAGSELGTKSAPAKEPRCLFSTSRPCQRMSSYQEHISLQPSICLQPDDPKVHLATRDDKPSLALSDKFFYGGCKFLYSAERMFHHQNNDTIPEVILLGTSNVGKSTFINGLIGATQQAGARTSKKAGHTKLLNAFGVGGPSRLLHHPMFDTASEVAPATAAEQKPVSSPGPPRYGLILVDSPGYGFRSRASWGDTIVRYIQMRRALCGAVVLLSAKKPMQDADRWVLSELAKAGRRTMIVITKADSIGKDWEAKCGELAAKIRGEMRSLDASWAQNDGWLPDIYVTAAGMPKPGGIGYGAGLSGVRRAILEMVGYNLEAATTKTKPEDVQYDGDVVPFDEIKYKT